MKDDRSFIKSHSEVSLAKIAFRLLMDIILHRFSYACMQIRPISNPQISSTADARMQTSHIGLQHLSLLI